MTDPADVIRRAADLMKGRADKAIADGWIQPTSIDEDHLHARGPVVGAGVAPYYEKHPEAWTPTKYVGDIEEVSFAEHIVAWNPTVAKVVAELLFTEAEDIDGDGAVLRRSQSGRLEVVSRETGYPLACWTRTYELALAYLGEAPDA